jgi:hypothetical protein
VSEETSITLALFCILTASVLISWFAKLYSNRHFTNLPAWWLTVIAGTLPTGLMVFGLWIWHLFAYQEYHRGAQGGWMSPLLFLIYGFWFWIPNLAFNVFVAYRTRRKA